MYNDDGTLQSWVPSPDTKKFKKLKENQVYKTEEEFYKKNPDWKCPKCGKNELYMD
jgi:ubiquitin C-terminal hydrolase